MIETRSLSEVLEVLGNGGQVELDLTTPPQTTYEICAAALANRHLDLPILKIDGSNRKARFLATGRRLALLEDWESVFPPLSFVSFGHDSFLRGRAPIINRDHGFSTWFFGVVTMLAERYLGILHQIRTNLLHDDYHWTSLPWIPDSAIEAVNGALERLARLELELRPPKSAYLKPSDLRDNWNIEA